MLGHDALSRWSISSVERPKSAITLLSGIPSEESVGAPVLTYTVDIAPPSAHAGEVFGSLDFSIFDITVFEIFYTPRTRKTIWIIPQEDD